MLQENQMLPKIYHGDLTLEGVAQALVARFNRGNLRSQVFSGQGKTVVQVGTREGSRSGGQTALTVSIQKVADGISVQMGKQNWLGVAASLGMTAFTALRNPLNLLNRLDDLAQDFESIQLYNEVVETIEACAREAGASFELSERLKRLTCAYCGTAVEVGAPSCPACGAPMGIAQPRTCLKCGFVVRHNEGQCPNCGERL